MVYSLDANTDRFIIHFGNQLIIHTISDSLDRFWPKLSIDYCIVNFFLFIS